METEIPVETETEAETSGTEKKEQIDISDGLSTEEVNEINKQFSQNPKEIVKNLQKESKEKEIASKILLPAIEKSYLKVEKTQEIEELLTLLTTLSTLDPKIQQTKEGETNPYNTIKTALEEKKQAIDDKEKQEKKESNEKEQGLISLQNILNAPNNSPEELLQNGTKIFEKDRLAYDALFENREKLQTNENLRKIILTYALGGADIEEKLQYKEGDKDVERAMYQLPTAIDLTRFTTEDTKYQTGTPIIQIPAEAIPINTVQNNILGQKTTTPDKKYEIFFGTTDQLHTARAQKTIQDNKIDDLFTDTKPNDIANIIDNLDEKGSYKAFRAFLDKADAKYLQQNFSMILSEIQKTHNSKEDDNQTDKYEGKEDKINGYYRIIAEKVIDLAQKGDKDTLSTYLQFISQNPAFLGTDSKNKIITWNDHISPFASTYPRDMNNPKDKEIKELIGNIHIQINPNIKKDIISQVGEDVDKFIELYGDILFKLGEFFGGKAAIMKMFAKCDDNGKNCQESSISKYIAERYQKEYKLSEEKITAYNDIDKAVDPKLKDLKIDINNNKTPYSQFRDNFEGSTYYAQIQDNISVINPETMLSLVLQYNKNNSASPLDISHYIQKDKTGKAIKIKAIPEEKIFKEVIFKNQSLRKDIAEASKSIKGHKSDFIGQTEEDENIKGNGITSAADAARYLTLTLMTSPQKLKNTIVENHANIKIGSTTTEIAAPVTVEQQEEYNQLKTRMANLETALTNKKYNNNGNLTDFPTDYDPTDNNKKYTEYETNILKEIDYMAFKGEITHLSEIAEKDFKTNGFNIEKKRRNIEKIIERNPKYLQDTIKHKAAQEGDTEKKNALNTIATLLEGTSSLKTGDGKNGERILTTDNGGKFTFNKENQLFKVI